MAFSFPSSPTDGQIYEIFGKKWQYQATPGVWKTYLETPGSTLGELSDVIASSHDESEILLFDGNKWVPSQSSAVGDYLTDVSHSGSISGSTFHFSTFDSKSYSDGYEQQVYYSGSYFYTGSTQFEINNTLYTNTASYVNTVESASTYANDIFLTTASFDGEYISMSFSDTSSLFQRLDYGKVKTVNTVTASGIATNNIAVAIADVSTGLSSSFPTSPADADYYVVSGETGSTSGSNGLVYVYAATASNWFEISAPTDEDRINRYVNVSGDRMSGSFYITSSVTPSDDLDIVTKDYVDDLAFQSGSRAFQGYRMYLTTWRWIASYLTDSQTNKIEFNDTDGKIEQRTWVAEFTVPNNVEYMSFQGGIEQSTLGHVSDYNGVLTRVRTEGGIRKWKILASNTVGATMQGRTNYYRNLDPQWNSNLTVNTGPVPVQAGDIIRFTQRGNDGSGTLALGLDKGYFFSGYVHKTVNPQSRNDIRTNQGLTGGGSSGTLTIAIDGTVGRGNQDNNFQGNQTINDVIDISGGTTFDDATFTGTSVLPGKIIMTSDIDFQVLQEYENDEAAAANGVLLNGLYRNGNLLMIRIS